MRSPTLTWLLAALALSALAGCTSETELPDGQSGPTAVVVKGDEVVPARLRRAAGPVARHFPASEVVVYLTPMIYSGSCPPSGDVETSEDGIVTLDVHNTGDVCTADAVRYTFFIQGLDVDPTLLVVNQDGQDQLELDITDLGP